jgi:hypothetical protein
VPPLRLPRWRLHPPCHRRADTIVTATQLWRRRYDGCRRPRSQPHNMSAPHYAFRRSLGQALAVDKQALLIPFLSVITALAGALLGAFVATLLHTRSLTPKVILVSSGALLAFIAFTALVDPRNHTAATAHDDQSSHGVTSSPPVATPSSSAASSPTPDPSQASISTSPVSPPLPPAARIVEWSLSSSTVSAGGTLSVRYVVADGLPADVVAVQRAEGSASVYRTIKQFPLAANGGSVPAPPMGKWPIRLAVLRDGDISATSTSRQVLSFGEVRLSAVLPQGRVHEGTSSAGSTVFNYVYRAGNCDLVCYDDVHEILSIGHSSCRSIDLRVLADPGSDGGSATIMIKQDASDPIERKLANLELTSIKANFHGQSFSVQWQGDLNGAIVMLDGTLSCYTKSGTA